MSNFTKKNLELIQYALESAATHPHEESEETRDQMLELAMVLGDRTTSDPWEDNRVQFARLLSEISAVGLTEQQYTGLSTSMDLPRERIDEVLRRADQEFEDSKLLPPQPGSEYLERFQEEV